MPVKYGNYTGYMEAKYIYGTQAWNNEHPSVPVLQAIAIEWIVHSTDSYSEDVMLTVDPAIGNSTTEESSVVPQSAYQAITVDSSANKSDYLDYVKNYFYASYTQLSGMPDTIDHKIRLRLTYSNSNTPSYINLAITSKGELVYQYPTTVYADTGSTVRIRSGPSASSSTVTNVPIGSTIYCLDQPSGYQGDWIRVKYGTYEGYMMAKYVVGTDAYEDAYGGGGTEPSDKEIAGVAILGIVHKSSGTTGDPGNWAVVLNHRYPGSGSQTSSASDSYDSYGSGAKTGSVGTYFGQIPYTNYYAQHSSSSCSHGVWHKAILSVSYTDSGAPERVLIEFYSTAT